MRQLKISDRITGENQRRCSMLFQDVRTALEQNLAGTSGKGKRRAYVYAALDALADMTIEFVARDPRKRKYHRQAGFESSGRESPVKTPEDRAPSAQRLRAAILYSLSAAVIPGERMDHCRRDASAICDQLAADN